MDEVKPRTARTLGAWLVRVAVSAVALGVGVWLLHYSWGFIFRDYKDSPLLVYVAFSLPAWLPGLLLVAFGWRTLVTGFGSHRAGLDQHVCDR